MSTPQSNQVTPAEDLAKEKAVGLSRSTTLFLMTTAFLNVMGMTIVLPVLPFLVKQYLSAPNTLAAVVGWLSASYAICQFIAAPGLGVLSDRFGRRPVLFVCLFGSVLGFLLFGIGGALWVLFLGRIIDGLTGGNFSILAAYIGDVSKPEERGKLFGRIGGVGGVGLIIGPVIGGFAAKFGYSAPLYLAAGILFATMVWGFFVMPESLAPENHKKQITLADLNPFQQIGNIFAITRLRWLMVTRICYLFPFFMFTTVLSVLLVDKLNWTPENIGLMLLLIGCIDIVMQGFLSEKFIARWGEVRLIIAGLLCHVVGFALVGAVALFPNPVLLIIGILFFAVASGLLEPSLNALISNATRPDEQGAVQGSNTAIQALGGIAGPLLAGELYIRFGGQIPYWGGAAILLLGIVAIGLAAQHLDPRHLVVKTEPVVS